MRTQAIKQLWRTIPHGNNSPDVCPSVNSFTWIEYVWNRCQFNYKKSSGIDAPFKGEETFAFQLVAWCISWCYIWNSEELHELASCKAYLLTLYWKLLSFCKRFTIWEEAYLAVFGYHPDISILFQGTITYKLVEKPEVSVCLQQQIQNSQTDVTNGSCIQQPEATFNMWRLAFWKP